MDSNPGNQKKPYRKNIFNDKRLEDYQKWDLLKLLDIVQKQFKRPKEIQCLDIGASAVEANIFSKYVKKVVGINISQSYLKTDQVPKNVELVVMDGTNLKFPAEAFDFVYSINLLEHIHGVSKCIDEQLRVVKPEGYCFATWYPLWSSGRGHHVQDDMVREWEKELTLSNQGFRNDGTFISDWDHLILSKKEMKSKLLRKLESEKLVHHIVDFIYSSPELNRVFFDQVMDIMKDKKLEIVEISRQEEPPPVELREKLKTLHPFSDFSTAGCQILFKKVANW